MHKVVFIRRSKFVQSLKVVGYEFTSKSNTQYTRLLSCVHAYVKSGTNTSGLETKNQLEILRAVKMSFFTNRFDIQIDLVKNKSLQISSRPERSIREVHYS